MLHKFTRHVSTFDLPIPEAGDIRAHKRFSHPLLTRKPGKETLMEQLESLGSHQSAQTVNSELCIVRRDGDCIRIRLSPRPSKPLKCSNRN